MMESIFGSAQPVWTGIPSPGYGWLPTSLPIAARPVGSTAPNFGPPAPTARLPILPNPIGDLTAAIQASNLPPIGPPGLGYNPPAVGLGGVPGLFSPSFVGEVGAGIPAYAL